MSQIDTMAKHMESLVSLGVDEHRLAEMHPTSEQLRELLKGILYLKEIFPSFFDNGFKGKVTRAQVLEKC